MALVAAPPLLELGEEAVVEVAFMYEPEVSYDAIKPGVRVSILEGNQVVGDGIVDALVAEP